MSREKQTKTNPFPNSDSNKRYYTYDYYLRKTFGGKCVKIPLNAGLSCPNVDGRCGRGGCIYCSAAGSGDFTESPELPIAEQFEKMKEKLSSKWDTGKYIPYFQARTNTYAPLSVLKEKFEAALALDGVVGMNIATRADCLEDDVVEYLAQLAERTTLTVELGLQTAHDKTAEIINRGHTYSDFLAGYEKLRRASSKIKICVHLIFGLPGEDEDMIMQTARQVASLAPDMVKIHLLHVLRGTKLAKMYQGGEYVPLQKDEYVALVAKSLQYFDENTVIARVTGDGMKEDLLAPLWSLKKVSVINDIDKYLYENNIYQGKLAKQ